jgi:outer membrane receptor protein involved in Fe transport
MTGLPRKILIILAVLSGLLMSTALIFAGSTGKIKGVVTDTETGEPLIGVSVQIVGTTQGAMTDPDGKYFIILVPPGKYVLKLTSVSYSSVEVGDVVVSTDLTTEINVKMEKAVADLNKVIKVTADRDKIDKFVTSNEIKVSADVIKTMPVQNVDKILQQTAGVVTTAQGEILIRGGRPGEVAYIVDGVTIGDPLGGQGAATLGLSLNSGSIQEISIIKDGFDPEYGNALSGVVKITSQTGSADETNMGLTFITDDFGNNDLNKYSEDYDYMAFSLSGPDPILKKKILPSLGLNFLEDKELTFFFYAEMTKSGTPYNYNKWSSPTTSKDYRYFNLFGIHIPERQNNDYNINTNIKIKPRNNLTMILSYKMAMNHQSLFEWDYRYTPNTATIAEVSWQTISLETTHQISKNMHYYLRTSYYTRDNTYKPGDPNNPGYGLNPDQFLRYNEFESFADNNGNGVYDAPEPLINLFPDTMQYGRDLSGPRYTNDGITEYNRYTDVQSGSFYTDFRFNDGSSGTGLEGEPFVDINGNGVWDAGDYLTDTNGNGVYDEERRDVIGSRTAEPYLDGDVNLGEPFTDVNNNGQYEKGIDLFVMSPDPALNQDLDRNSRYTYPEEPWRPGIPYIDRNGNGVFDYRNYEYDPGEAYTDVNGNGRYDNTATKDDFLDIGSYTNETIWHHRSLEEITLEGRITRIMGPHEIKAGGLLSKQKYVKEDIRSLEQIYNGRDDGGNYPGIGELRDFYTFKPWGGAFYIKDNLEYGSMIASLGFRYDFYIQTTGLEEIAKNDDLGSGVIFGDRTRFSPRIGFSYPISDKAKIHFNYGHFYQLPELQFMYDRNTTAAGKNDIIGNYNLDFVKTIQYSFGVKYAMSENYSVDVAGYFKDEFDKINSADVKLGGALTVQRYENKDYGRSRGFEVTIDKRGGRLINGDINYSYAFAYGKQSQSRTAYLSSSELDKEPLSEKPLDNDVRHAINCNIQLVIAKNSKPVLFGLRIPDDWNLSIGGEFETGKPFTPDAKFPNLYIAEDRKPEENSMRMPSILSIDARFAKMFTLAKLDWSLILWIDNVLDNRNVQGIYTATGRADTRQNDGNNIRGGKEYDRDPENWRRGRQVKLGLQVNI